LILMVSVQDVMKLLVFFYVTLNIETTAGHSSSSSVSSSSSNCSETSNLEDEVIQRRDRELRWLFGEQKTSGTDDNDSNNGLAGGVSIKTMSCLQHWTIRAVCCVVRRAPAKSELYEDIQMLQNKYRGVSILRHYRQLQNESKKHRQRFDPNEVRTKTTSRNQLMWEDLNKPLMSSTPELEETPAQPALPEGQRQNDIGQERDRLKQKRYRQMRRQRENAQRDAKKGVVGETEAGDMTGDGSVDENAGAGAGAGAMTSKQIKRQRREQRVQDRSTFQGGEEGSVGAILLTEPVTTDSESNMVKGKLSSKDTQEAKRAAARAAVQAALEGAT
jgi:hypothetical protein